MQYELIKQATVVSESETYNILFLIQIIYSCLKLHCVLSLIIELYNMWKCGLNPCICPHCGKVY